MDPSFNLDSLGTLLNGGKIAVQPDGKVLVAGGEKPIILRLNADGSLDAGFSASVDGGGVETLALQPDGKILLGGYFNQVNGQVCNGVARLNADGTLDAGFNASAPGIIFALAVQPDGKILLGGSFEVNGQFGRNLARLNADGSLDAGFPGGSVTNPNRTEVVFTLTVQPDGKILLGGGFDQVNGQARSNLARLNANGSLDAGFTASVTGDFARVNSVAVQADGKILLGGFFTAINGQTRSIVARLNADGSLDAGFQGGTNPDTDVVFALAVQADGKILLGGRFSQVNGQFGSNLARLNADGSPDADFNASTDNSVFTLAVQADGKILLGGAFIRVNGQAQIGIARLTNNGGLDEAFVVVAASGLNGAVSTVAVQPDGKILLGGIFTQVSGLNCGGIVRLNADGSLDAGFSAGTNGGGVFSLAVQPDGKILLGGVFSTVNGQARSNLARLNADGSLDADFNASTDDTVSTLAVQPDGRILLGGRFAQVNGQARGRVARLNANGTLDVGFNASTDDGVSTLAVQPNGKILLGGYFNQVNGQVCNGVARLNADGSLDAGFQGGNNPRMDIVFALAVQPDGKILLGGTNTRFNDPRRNLFRLNADGSTDAGFNANAKRSVYTLAVQADGKILIGGQFSFVNGERRSNLARLNADGSLDADFNASAGGSVEALAVQPDGKILLGGDFIQVIGEPRSNVARLDAFGTLDAGFVPGVGVPQVSSLGIQPDDGNVIIGGAFSFAGRQFANALARLRPDGKLDPTFSAPFAPGDRVEALQQQPSSGGGIIASAIVRNTLASSRVRNPIIRSARANGRADASFNPNAETDGLASSLGIQADGKIVVAGNFTKLNNTTGHSNIGRLDANGYLDATFNASTNGPVQTVLVQPDGRIVIGGTFTQVNGVGRQRLARLLANGSLDPSFSASAGTDGPVAALKLQRDGRLVVGGAFSTANGVGRSCIARLNSDGTLDNFSCGTMSLSGGSAVVSTIEQQPDGKIVMAGLFDNIGGEACNKVARCNVGGGVDSAYDPGAGPDAIVRAIALQPDGKALIGGDFSTVDGTGRSAVARLLGDFDLNDYPPLGQWRIVNFGTPDNAGDAADLAMPFGDGVVNLLKFALNLNAQAADATSMLPAGRRGLPLVARNAEGRLTLTFVRRQSGTAPGITYVVEFADGLTGSDFAVNPAATVGPPVPIDAVWERVTVTDSVPMSAQTRRFVRLRVTN